MWFHSYVLQVYFVKGNFIRDFLKWERLVRSWNWMLEILIKNEGKMLFCSGDMRFLSFRVTVSSSTFLFHFYCTKTSELLRFQKKNNRLEYHRTRHAWQLFLSTGLCQLTQPAITCSKLTIETLEQGVKYVQS